MFLRLDPPTFCHTDSVRTRTHRQAPHSASHPPDGPLCLPKTSSPHYVHWALLRISRRPASITGHADRLSRTVHPRWAQACRARRRSRLRTRRFVINERSCSDRPAGARGCGPLTGCSGRGSVTCGPDGGERSSSSSPTPFSGGIDEGFGAIGAGRVGRADPVGHASRAPFKCSSARCATPTRPGAPRASTASC